MGRSAWSRTRMGGWAVAQSPILVTTITLKRLIQRGYESLLSYYEQISPQLNEPLYTRPVAPMLKLRRKHTYSGHAFGGLRQINVRGAPVSLTTHGPSTRLPAVRVTRMSILVLCHQSLFFFCWFVSLILCPPWGLKLS